MSDDSHNLSAQDYDDQYDDEISESRGFSPGHSDDVQVVHARPVGGKPAKARPTVPIRSISSKATLKKEKVHKGEGTSSGPKGKSVSKPNMTGGNDVELDTDGAHDTLIEMSVKEEEQVGKLLGKGVTYKVDRSLTSIANCHRNRWIGVHFDSLKAGMRFPLDSFLVAFVNYYRIVPGRIAPNGHRILACFPQICQRHQVPCTIDLFNFLYLVKAMGKSYGGSFIMIQCRGPIGKIVDLPDNNRRWRGKYLRVRLDDDLPFKNEWSSRMRKYTLPSETPEIRAAVERISTESYSWEHYHSPKAFAAMQLPLPFYGSSGQTIARGPQEMDFDYNLDELAGLAGKASSGGQITKSLKVAIKRKSTTSADQHNVDRPPIESCPSSSSVAQDQTKSTGKRPMEVTKVEPPADVHAADPKRSRLAGDTPRLADALARHAFSLPEMFNLLFQMSPPPASLVNEATDVVAGQVAHHLSQVASGTAELFVRAMVNVSHRDQEIRELKEKVRHLEAQVDTLNRYPDSDQFFQDAAALYPFRPANLPALVKSFCSSEGAATPLLQALHQDPIGLQVLRRVTAWGYHRGKYVMQESLHRALADGLEDWEQVRALLPEQIPPPGPEPFSDPLVGPTDLNTTNSQSHVP
nr:uncharacterized protein LOC109149872 [Ipomoea batatas]